MRKILLFTAGITVVLVLVFTAAIIVLNAGKHVIYTSTETVQNHKDILQFFTSVTVDFTFTGKKETIVSWSGKSEEELRNTAEREILVNLKKAFADQDISLGKSKGAEDYQAHPLNLTIVFSLSTPKENATAFLRPVIYRSTAFGDYLKKQRDAEVQKNNPHSILSRNGEAFTSTGVREFRTGVIVDANNLVEQIALLSRQIVNEMVPNAGSAADYEDKLKK